MVVTVRVNRARDDVRVVLAQHHFLAEKLQPKVVEAEEVAAAHVLSDLYAYLYLRAVRVFGDRDIDHDVVGIILVEERLPRLFHRGDDAGVCIWVSSRARRARRFLACLRRQAGISIFRRRRGRA